MKLCLRLTRALYESARADLRRPHPFAAERVGFLFGKAARAGADRVVLTMHAYVALLNDEYVDDRSAGAVFSSGALRRMRQRVLDTGESAFHVHEHPHIGRPAFSTIDIRSLAELVPSFGVLVPEAPHGALLLSDDAAAGMAWSRDIPSPFVTEAISVVGYPMQVWRHE